MNFVLTHLERQRSAIPGGQAAGLLFVLMGLTAGGLRWTARPVAAQIVPELPHGSIYLPAVLRVHRFSPMPAQPTATPTAVPTQVPVHVPGVPDCERTVGDAGGLRFSRDGGATLAPGARPLAAVAYTWDIETDPRDPDVVLELHQGALYRSRDAGCRFTRLDGVPSGEWDRITRAPSRPEMLVLTSIFASRLAYTTDDGASWQTEALPDDVVQFAIDPADPWHWRFAGRMPALYVRAEPTAKWESRRIPYPGDEQTVSAAHVDTPDGGSIWLAGSQFDGLWRSTDEGMRWEPVSSGLFGTVGEAGETVSSVVVVSVVFAPSDPMTAYTAVNRVARQASERGIFRSKDGGQTWSRRVKDGTAVGDRSVALTGGTQVFVSPYDPDHAFFAFGMNFQGYGTDLFRSTDGLKTLVVSHFDDLYDIKTMAFGVQLEPPVAGRALRPLVYVGGSSARPSAGGIAATSVR